MKPFDRRFPGVDVTLIQWPAGEEQRAALASRGEPRLLLVEADSPPPQCIDLIEDWVRLPTPPGDIRARVDDLRARTIPQGSRVLRLDRNGTLCHGHLRAELTPHQARLLRPLTERFGTVVLREELIASGWPEGSSSSNTLDASIVRLRQKIRPLSLRIRAVRSRGYLLEDSGQHTQPSA